MTEKLMIHCRRCIMDGVSQTELMQTLEDWISAIPEDMRADGGEYAARLEVCNICEKLAGATCSVCGCFPAYRAAKRDAKCPEPGGGRWTDNR